MYLLIFFSSLNDFIMKFRFLVMLIPFADSSLVPSWLTTLTDVQRFNSFAQERIEREFREGGKEYLAEISANLENNSKPDESFINRTKLNLIIWEINIIIRERGFFASFSQVKRN